VGWRPPLWNPKYATVYTRLYSSVLSCPLAVTWCVVSGVDSFTNGREKVAYTPEVDFQLLSIVLKESLPSHNSLTNWNRNFIYSPVVLQLPTSPFSSLPNEFFLNFMFYEFILFILKFYLVNTASKQLQLSDLIYSIAYAYRTDLPRLCFNRR